MTDTLRHIDATMDERLTQLFELVRIPSISTDPDYTTDVARAAFADERGRLITCGTGGSRPILGALRDKLGVDALLVCFGRLTTASIAQMKNMTCPAFAAKCGLRVGSQKGLAQ